MTTDERARLIKDLAAELHDMPEEHPLKANMALCGLFIVACAVAFIPLAAAVAVTAISGAISRRFAP